MIGLLAEQAVKSEVLFWFAVAALVILGVHVFTTKVATLLELSVAIGLLSLVLFWWP